MALYQYECVAIKLISDMVMCEPLCTKRLSGSYKSGWDRSDLTLNMGKGSIHEEYTSVT